MKQSTALAILKTGQNVFLTGQAGAGKTYVLNQYIDYLRARKVPIAITASTGIAATHMNGMTIHAWSGIGITNEFEKLNLKKMANRSELVERLLRVKVLIVDEISMLHLKQVDTINAVLQHFRKNDAPFGGVQVIFSGDFFQLPPIGEKDETAKEKYAFMAKSWKQSNFQICYLTEQHRQSTLDEGKKYGLSLNEILNQIRSQHVTQQAVDILKYTQQHQIHANRTRLYTHNLDVDKINHQQLQNLSTKEHLYQAQLLGDRGLLESLAKSIRTPKELVLKVGAKVMFVKNLSMIGVYNGTMGEVVSFLGLSGKRYAADEVFTETAYPVVRLNNGQEVCAEPESWTVEDAQGEVLASYTQVPLCLAWAITVHKSQGMTLDAAEIDLSKTFETGQGYVALSRLRSLDGLKLLGLNTKSLLLDEWVQLIDRRFIELSKEHEAKFESLDEATCRKIHKSFIEAVGGLTNEKLIADFEKLIQKQKEKQKQQITAEDRLVKQDTFEQTLQLIEQKLSIEQIVKQRQLAKATIIEHIKRLKEQNPNLDVSSYQPDVDVLKKVQQAYEILEAQGLFVDGVKLRPIVEELSNKYDYNEVRLALIFIDKKV